jgi:hypothetical protein
MKNLRLFSLPLLLVTICIASASAQDVVQPNAKATGKGKTETAPPEYVLQLSRPEGCVVAPVSATQKSKYGQVLYPLPRPARVPADNTGRPIVSTVSAWAYQVGAQWRVRVAVGRGEFFDVDSTQVGEFTLATNQRATVTEVSKFGLSPIQVGVMKIVRQKAGKPSFSNLAPSISLEAMEVGHRPDPFKLALKNNSSQDLIAIQYNTFGSTGFIALKWFSPGLLVPLINSGEAYTLEVASEDNSCGDDDGYHPNQLNRIEMVSAVFADGTYEGEPALAALIKGTALGNRKNLERVVQSIAYITDPIQLAQQLNYLQQGMNEDAEPFLVETLRSMFPMLTPDARDALTNYIRSGMHEVKVNLARDALHLQSVGEHNNPQLNQRVVETIQAKYERWWTAAQNMTSH